MALSDRPSQSDPHGSRVRVASFDPAARAAEKQASRDADAAALRAGAKTVEQLRSENSFALPAANATIDYRAIPRARFR